MTLNLDNSTLRKIIPGVIHEVDGEDTLFDKLYPWLSSARLWLEQCLLGDGFQPPEQLEPIAVKTIVYKAFADAVPSLDLTLSPAGFAVITTEGRAPASKERVERLVSSLRYSMDQNIIILCAELHKLPEWRMSHLGEWYMSTFIPGFSDVGRFRSDKDLITTYKIMRDIALRFELRLAELYIGHEVLSVLRSAYPVFVVPATKTLYEMVRVAELRFISSRISQPHCGDMECVDAHEVWHLARPVIASLPMCPELYTAWCRDMRGDDMSAFKHKKQGGIFL